MSKEFVVLLAMMFQIASCDATAHLAFSVFKRPHKYSVGLKSGDCGHTKVHDSQDSLVFFGLQLVLAKLLGVFGATLHTPFCYCHKSQTWIHQ